MKMNYTLIAVLASTLLTTSRANRKVTRINPVTEQQDISGAWNAIDSKMVSDEMISQVLMDKWVTNHTTAKSKNPVVIVGMVTNKSHEHIEAEMFIKDLERAFLRSDKVRLVQSGKKERRIKSRKSRSTNECISKHYEKIWLRKWCRLHFTRQH